MFGVKKLIRTFDMSKATKLRLKKKNMNAQQFKELLFKFSACEECREFCEGKSIQEFWAACERGDWMMWLYARASNYDLSVMSLAKGHCANTVRHLMKDERSIAAVDAAIAFGEGLISEEELSVASHASSAASHAAHAASASVASVAYAAASAAHADSASAAAAAAYAVADSASAASAYAYAYAFAAASNRKRTADICRKYLPLPIFN